MDQKFLLSPSNTKTSLERREFLSKSRTKEISPGRYDNKDLLDSPEIGYNPKKLDKGQSYKNVFTERNNEKSTLPLMNRAIKLPLDQIR